MLINCGAKIQKSGESRGESTNYLRIKRISAVEFEAAGTASLDDINKICGLKLESDDYDSIAGHVINLLNHLPTAGETVTSEGVRYTVAAVLKNRVTKVKIKLPDAPEE